MILCEHKQVHIHGMDYEVLAELARAAAGLAEDLGEDRVLEACLLGIYAHSREQAEKLHEILRKGGITTWKAD